MRKAKIVLVAEWDGWCGACAVERPLALTRTGRLGLATWLTAPVTETRPLTLTCRLCGHSTVVPAEADDPPVLVEPDDVPATAGPASAGPAVSPPPPMAVTESPVPAAPAELTVELTPVLPVRPTPVHRSAELDRARAALGSALGALLTERTAQAAHETLAPSVPALAAPAVPALAPAVPALAPAVPALAPVAAPALPLQRTSSADTDGLAALQLLADGLDLLSSTRG